MGYRWRVNDNRALFPGTQVHQRDRTGHLDFFGTLKEKRWRSRYCSVPVRYVGRLKATRKSVQVVRIQEWKNGQKTMMPSYIIIVIIIIIIYVYIMPNAQGRFESLLHGQVRFIHAGLVRWFIFQTMCDFIYQTIERSCSGFRSKLEQ